jgi:8-amino-7-oxononanoate synthase
MGTLSKALGSLGGYVAGTQNLIEFLRNRASTWIYTTGLSPADTAAALTAIQLIQAEPQRQQQLWQNITTLNQGLIKLNLRRSVSPAPILWIGLQHPEQALQLSCQLKHHGIFAPAIRPPTVPSSRIRFSVMATHTPAHLDYLLQTLHTLLPGQTTDKL